MTIEADDHPSPHRLSMFVVASMALVESLAFNAPGAPRSRRVGARYGVGFAILRICSTVGQLRRHQRILRASR